MKEITTPTHKPALVVGPYLSPFSSPAMDKENLVLVASGIGVTPSISIIKQYASTNRRLNLIWICRDAGLVEHFLTNVHFGTNGYTLIYYTGKRSLVLQDDLPPNIFIFDGRPNLERSISGIVHSIVSGEGLPEELNHSNEVISKTPVETRTKLLLERVLSIYSIAQLFDYTVEASGKIGNERASAAALDRGHVVTYSGMIYTMKQLLGDDCELLMDQITSNIEEASINGAGLLDRNEFENFFRLMIREDNTDDARNVVQNIFDTQQNTTKITMDEFGIRKFLQGDDKFAAKNWSMLYCGGSEPVLAQLRAFKKKFGIGLAVEKFDW